MKGESVKRGIWLENSWKADAVAVKLYASYKCMVCDTTQIREENQIKGVEANDSYSTRDK